MITLSVDTQRMPHVAVLASIISEILGCSNQFEWESDQRRWRLDSGNNWWLHLTYDAQANTERPIQKFEICYRYEGGNPELMSALKTLLIWRLGLERWNNED